VPAVTGGCGLSVSVLPIESGSMDISASSWNVELVHTLLRGIDGMQRQWAPDASVVLNLETLIERLRSEDLVCIQLGALLRTALTNPNVHTHGMVRGALLAVHAHCTGGIDDNLDSQYNEPGLTTLERQRVLDYVNIHLATAISLSDVVAASGVRHARFSRALARATGLTPQRWLLLQRIERVKHLLARGDLSLEQISIACGFSSQSHLTRTFVQLAGTTPRKWRRLRCGSGRTHVVFQKSDSRRTR
jgi:AraC-like DNA-binding protein